MAAAALALLALAAAGTWWLRPVDTAIAKQPIAVLPFDNLGRDEATGRLADDITEDIITDLSRFGEFAVIARNSTAVYADKPVDVRQVGTDLNVGYVLEGSVQRQGDHFRVTAQLVDAETGAHVWSERWDRPAADEFALQTEIVQQAVGADYATAHPLALESARRALEVDPMDAGAHALLGLQLSYDGDYARGKSELDTALRLNPGSADILALTAERISSP